MILVTGDAVARPETFDEVRRLSLEHVHRSRTEPGCISHALHIDCVNPLRFVFVEQWADKEVLMDHFRVPESRGFVKALRGLLAEPTDNPDLRRGASAFAIAARRGGKPLVGGPSTVDHQGRTGHQRRCIAGEENNCPHQILDCAKATELDLL